jgi:hypothetical protein
LEQSPVHRTSGPFGIDPLNTYRIGLSGFRSRFRARREMCVRIKAMDTRHCGGYSIAKIDRKLTAGE